MAKPKNPSTAKNAVQKLGFNHPTNRTSPIELVRISDLRKRDAYIDKPTRLDFHLIQFVTEGRGKHWVDFEPINLGRGDLLHIQPSQVHSFDPRSRHEALLLLFRPEAVSSPSLLSPLNFNMHGAVHPQRADFNILLDILGLYQSQQAIRGSINADRLAPYCLGAIVAAIGDLLQHSESSQTRSNLERSEQLVYRFETHLQTHHASHRDLEWYVSELNLTGRTLARACHSVRGESPKKVIDARITLEAKRQLILSTDTIEEIAFSLGFSESTNFVKFFKRIAGTTPDGFRKSQISCH